VERLQGVIFDYGNTLVRLDPSVRSRRTDYADVVARPGAERLQRVLASEGLLDGSALRDGRFIERWLEVREKNRLAAEETGREITAAESLAETLQGMGAASAGTSLLERAVAEFFVPEVELVRPVAGAAETLRGLRSRGVRLALLSNATSGAYVAGVVERMGWTAMFDPLVVSADIGVRKPRPEAFRAVLDRWPLEPGAVAMVGDSLYHDVGGARALGLMTVHFTAIANALDERYAGAVRPTFEASTHEDLLEVLLRAAG
jgi:putative hydrolase of the HAD superfamily